MSNATKDALKKGARYLRRYELVLREPVVAHSTGQQLASRAIGAT